ncbi:titin-like [Periplaneta americana]|uniref:titin-like n=1 Tax=Periplaneta americana TaxID=6978 RepID=UPI0037E72ED8
MPDSELLISQNIANIQPIIEEVSPINFDTTVAAQEVTLPIQSPLVNIDEKSRLNFIAKQPFEENINYGGFIELPIEESNSYNERLKEIKVDINPFITTQEQSIYQHLTPVPSEIKSYKEDKAIAAEVVKSDILIDRKQDIKNIYGKEYVTGINLKPQTVFKDREHFTPIFSEPLYYGKGTQEPSFDFSPTSVNTEMKTLNEESNVTPFILNEGKYVDHEYLTVTESSLYKKQDDIPMKYTEPFTITDAKTPVISGGKILSDDIKPYIGGEENIAKVYDQLKPVSAHDYIENTQPLEAIQSRQIAYQELPKFVKSESKAYMEESQQFTASQEQPTVNYELNRPLNTEDSPVMWNYANPNFESNYPFTLNTNQGQLYEYFSNEPKFIEENKVPFPSFGPIMKPATSGLNVIKPIVNNEVISIPIQIPKVQGPIPKLFTGQKEKVIGGGVKSTEKVVKSIVADEKKIVITKEKLVAKNIEKVIVQKPIPLAITNPVIGQNKLKVIGDLKAFSKDKIIVKENIKPLPLLQKPEITKPILVPVKPVILPKAQNIIKEIVPPIAPNKNKLLIEEEKSDGINEFGMLQELQTYTNERIKFDEKVRSTGTIEEKSIIGTTKPLIVPLKKPAAPIIKLPVVTIGEQIKPVDVTHTKPITLGEIKPIIAPIMKPLTPTFKVPFAETIKPLMTNENKMDIFLETKSYSNEQSVLEENIKPLKIKPDEVIYKKPIALEEIPIKKPLVPFVKFPFAETVKPMMTNENKMDMFLEMNAYSNEQRDIEEKIKPLKIKPVVIVHKKPIILEENKPIIIPIKKPFTPVFKVPIAGTVKPIMTNKNEMDVFEERRTYSDEQSVFEEKFKPLNMKPIEIMYKKPITLEENKPIIVPIKKHLTPLFKVPITEAIKPIVMNKDKMDVFEEMRTYSDEQSVFEEKFKPLSIKPIEIMYKKPIILQENKPIIVPIKKPLTPVFKVPITEAVRPIMTNKNKMDVFEELRSYSDEQSLFEEKFKPLKIKPIEIMYKKPILLKENKPIIVPIKKPLTPVFKVPIIEPVKPIMTNKNKMDVFEELRSYNDEQTFLEEKFKPLNIKPVELIYKKPIILQENKPIIVPIKKPVTPVVKVPIVEAVKPIMTNKNKMDVFEEVRTYSDEQSVLEEKFKPLNIKPIEIKYKKPILLKENKPIIVPIKKPLTQVFKVPITEAIKPTMRNKNKMDIFEELRTYSDEQSLFEEKFKPLNIKPVELIYKKPIMLQENKPIIVPIRKPVTPVVKVPIVEAVKPIMTNKNKMDVFEEVRTYSDEQSFLEEKFKPVNIKPVELIDRRPIILEENKPIILPIKKPLTPFVKFPFAETMKPTMVDGNKMDIFLEMKKFGNEQPVVKEKIEPLKMKSVELVHKKPIILEDSNPNIIPFKKPIIPVFKVAIAEKVKPIMRKENKMNIFEEIKTYSNEQSIVKEKIKPLKIKPVEISYKKPITLEKIKPIIIPIKKPLIPVVRVPVAKTAKTTVTNENKMDVFEEIKTYSNEQSVVEEKIKPLKIKPVEVVFKKPIKLEEKKPIIIPIKKPLAPLSKVPVADTVKPIVTYENKADVFDELKTYSNEQSVVEKKPITYEEMKPQFFPDEKKSFNMFDRMSFYPEEKPMMYDENKYDYYKEYRTPDNEQEYFEEKYEPFEMNREPSFMNERVPLTLPNKKPVNIPEVIPAVKEVKLQKFAFPQEVKPAVLLTKKPVTLPNKIENIEGMKKFQDQEILGVKFKSFENMNKKSILTEEVKSSIIPENRLEILPNPVQVVKITKPLKPIIYQEIKPVHISNKAPIPKQIKTFVEKPNKLDVFENVKTYSNKQVFVKEHIKPFKVLDEKKIYEGGIKPLIVPDIKQTILSQRRPVPELKSSESVIDIKMKPIILPVKEPVPHLKHEPFKHDIIGKIEPITSPVIKPIIFPPKIKFLKENKPLKSPIIKEIKPVATLVTKPLSLPVKVSVVEEAKPLFLERHNAGMFQEFKTYSNSHATVKQNDNPLPEFEEKLLKDQHLGQIPIKNKFFDDSKSLNLPQIPTFKIPSFTRTDKKIFSETVGKDKEDMFHNLEAYRDEKFIIDKMKPLNIDEPRENVEFAKPISTQIGKDVVLPLIKKPQFLVADIKPFVISRKEQHPIGIGTQTVTQDVKSYIKGKTVFKEKFKPLTVVEQMPIAKKPSILPLPYIATMQRIKPPTIIKINPLLETKISITEKPTGPAKIIAAVLKESKTPKNINIVINKKIRPLNEPILISEQKPIFTKVPEVLGEKLTPLISGTEKATVVKELKSIENKNIITEEIIQPINTLNMESKLNTLKPVKVEHFKSFNKNKENMEEEVSPLDVFYSKLQLIQESGPSPDSGKKHLIFEGIGKEKEHQKLQIVHEAKSFFTDHRKQNIIKDFKPITEKIIALDGHNVMNKEEIKPPTPFKGEWQIFHKMKHITDHKMKPFNNFGLKRFALNEEHPVYDHYGSGILEDVKHGSADRKISIVSKGPKPIFVGGKVTSLIKKPLPIFFGENRGAVLDDLRPLGSRTVEVDNKIEHFDTFEEKSHLLNKPANIYDIISHLHNATSNAFASRSEVYHDIGHFEIPNKGDAIKYEVKTATRHEKPPLLSKVPKHETESKAIVFHNIKYPPANERKLESLQEIKEFQKESSISHDHIKPLTVIEKLETHPDKTDLITSSKPIMLPIIKHTVVETKHPIVEIKHVIMDTKPLIIGHRQTNTISNLKPVLKTVEPLLLWEDKGVNLEDMKSMKMYSQQKDTFLQKTKPIPLIQTEPLVSKIIPPKEEDNAFKNIKPLLIDSKVPVFEDTVPMKNPITGVNKNIITGFNDVRVNEELNTYTNKEIITQDELTHFSNNQKKHVAIPETKLVITPIRKGIVLEKHVSAPISIIKPLPKLQNPVIPPIIKHMVLEHHAPVVMEHKTPIFVKDLKPLPEFHKRLTVPIKKDITEGKLGPVIVEARVPVILNDIKPEIEFHKPAIVPVKSRMVLERSRPVIVEPNLPVFVKETKVPPAPLIVPLKKLTVFGKPRPVIVEPKVPIIVQNIRPIPKPVIVPMIKETVFEKPRPVIVEPKVPIIVENIRPIPKPVIVPMIKETVFEKPRPVIVEPKVPIIVENIKPIPKPLIVPMIKEAVFEKPRPVIVEPKVPIIVENIKPIPKPLIVPIIKEAVLKKPRLVVEEQKVPIIVQNIRPIPKPAIVPLIEESEFEKSRPLIVEPKLPIIDKIIKPEIVPVIRDTALDIPISVTVESKLPITAQNIRPLPKLLIGAMKKENIFGKSRPVVVKSKIPIFIQNLRPIPKLEIVPIKKDILLQNTKHIMMEPKVPVIVPHTKSVNVIHELKGFNEFKSHLAEDRTREISEFETGNKEKASITENMKLLDVSIKPILDEKMSIVVPTKKDSILEEVKHIFIDSKIPPVVVGSKPALLTNRNIIVKPKVIGKSEVNAIEESQTYSDQKVMFNEKIKSLHPPGTKHIDGELQEKPMKLYHQIGSKIPIVGHLEPKTFQTNTYKLPDLSSIVKLEKHSAAHEHKDLDVLAKFRLPEDKTSFQHAQEHISPKNIKESRLSFAEDSLHDKKSFAYEDSQAHQFEDKHAPHYDNAEHFQHDSNEYHDNGEKQFFSHEAKSMGFERHDSDDYHDNEYNEKAVHHDNTKYSEPHMDVHKSDFTDYEGRSYHVGDTKATSVENSKSYDDGHKKTVVIETKPHSIVQLRDLVFGGLKSLNIEHKDILEIPKALAKMKQIYTQSQKKGGDREQIKIHIRDSGDHGNANKLQRAHQFQNFRIKEAAFDNIKDFVYSIKTHGFKDSKAFGVHKKNQGIAHGLANSVSFSHYDKKELKPNLFEDMKYPIHIEEKVVGPKYSFGKKKSYTYDFTKDLGHGKESKYGKKQRFKFGKVSEHGYDRGKMKSFVEGHKYTSKKNVGHGDLKFYELGEKKGETVSDNIGFAAGKAFDIEKGIEKIFRIVL